ncbi:MAG: hypothetical protein R3F59_00620 [Myxococcota bacterium]
MTQPPWSRGFSTCATVTALAANAQPAAIIGTPDRNYGTTAGLLQGVAMDGVREALRRRAEVDDRDIDEIVGIAEELAEAQRRKVPVAEVERVAEELDIDPVHVEEAIAVLRDRRAAAEAQAEADAQAAAARAAQRRQALAWAVAVLAVLAVLGGGAVAWSARSLSAADAEVARAEGALDAVLQRQQNLVPQLVAMSGARVAVPALAPDAPVEARLAASEQLSRALTEALAGLPPAEDAAASSARLNLQHELAGAENRITVERTRWAAARAARDEVAGSVGGRLASALRP